MSKRLLSPFAHLGRRGAAAAEECDDDKSKSKKAEDGGKDEDDKSKSKAEDDDDKGGDKDKDKSKDAKAEDDDKSKDAKAEDDDEEDDQEPSARAARARERRRIRAIMVSAAGRADPVGAAHLAMDTAMPRSQAIGMLAAMAVSREEAAGGSPAPAAREGLRERMGAVQNPSVGPEASRGAPSLADQILAAGKKRRGEA